jgi:hypothetical protein
MYSVGWVEDCSAPAIADCNDRIGIETAATNERTVAGWNFRLKANCEHFPLPDLKFPQTKETSARYTGELSGRSYAALDR